MIEHHVELQGFDTGYESLNKLTNGWHKGDLMILASQTSVGKTAFALNLAQKVCERGGVVDFFTLEMPKLSLAKRILSNMTRIDGGKWKNPYWLFNEEDQMKALQALEVYGKWNFEIHDQRRLTISDIRARVQKTRREHPKENYMVVIDYLQLITLFGQYESHALAIFHFTRELKQIAEQYQVSIILLSQLSSRGEQKVNMWLRIAYLNELASIGENADIIMILNRDESSHNASKGNCFVKLDIVKDESVRTVKFLFGKEVGGFEEVL